MKVLNIHFRELAPAAPKAGALIDTLSSPKDALWPRHAWPRMTFDRPLGVGAQGGHGPIRYFVEHYTPGQRIRFRFIGPAGFDGYHQFEVIGAGETGCVLTHTLEMTARGPARLTWPLIFRPLHDALIEDALALGQASLGLTPSVRPWSGWVKLLRWLISKGRTRPQTLPSTAQDSVVHPE